MRIPHKYMWKSFKLFVIACKNAILRSYFAFFLLRSAVAVAQDKKMVILEK